MELKRYQKENCVAVWSNSKAHGQLIACASPNTNNPSLFDLQILSVDLADPSKNLLVEGKSIYNTSYQCLAWGTFGEKEGSLPYGLIFGGMDNGSFTLWNPAEMIGIENDIAQAHIDDQNSFIYAEQAEEDAYPIMCAQWNSLKPNYLAYGSTSLLILDVAKDLSSPDILKPSSNNPHEGSRITSVTWNKQVPHILASAGSDGLIALYDIKTNRSIFSFRDNSSHNNTRQVQIAWSKHISTQIAVTLDDEKKNELQIWDLRNQKGPIVVIDKGHSKGINTMDWSELDHDLILTGSRDSKLCCWNYKQDQQPLSSKRIDSQIVKVAWAKNLPSIYSITTNDGIAVCSLDDRNIHSYIPKWLKVPASSTFNGNDNLLTYSQERGNNLVQYNVKLQIKKDLAAEIAILEEFIESQNVENAKDEDAEFWKLISTKKNQEGDADIYDFLGLSKDKIVKELQKYTGKKRDLSNNGNNLKSSKKNKSKSSKADYIPVSVGQAASFFGSLSAEPVDKSFIKNDDENEVENIKYDMVPRNFNWDMGKQKLIKENMLIGNYEGAIDAALKCGRTAQALIIAYSIDQTTFNSTLKTFFTETTDKFISGILKHIAFKDTEELVNKYDLDKWKQCVALIFSLSSSQKRRNLLSLLANRLETQYPDSQQYRQASIYCFILAQEFDKIVEIYEQKLSKQKPNTKARKVSLVRLCTRLLAIYSCLTVNVKISTSFERIIRELALVCLQANKKLISYHLLTKYVATSSDRYINYLIQNTAELTTYRNQNNVIVNLPAMSKRQEKTKKSTKTAENVEEVPTNIKAPKQPKLPVKTIAFDDGESQKKKAVTVQPPPPPSRPTIVPIQPASESRKNVPPPPPPHGKKNQPFEDQEEEEQQTVQDNRKGQIPNFPGPKKGTTLPPPPPPPAKTNIKKLSPQEDDHHHQTKIPPPPPPPQRQREQVYQKITPPPHGSTRNPPPPPPAFHQKQQTLTPPVKVVPPSGPKNIPPPPPPKIHKQVTEDYEEERPTKTPTRITPPPPAKSLPPPPPKNIPKKQQVQQQCQEQQPPQKVEPRRNIPQPPPIKKSIPPPPPTKTVRLESQQSQQPEETNVNASFNQTGKRNPPPPPSVNRKAPPPPPRRQ